MNHVFMDIYRRVAGAAITLPFSSTVGGGAPDPSLGRFFEIPPSVMIKERQYGADQIEE